MKKLLLTFVLLVGIIFGAFAQKLTYQAVVRDNNQQLVTNTAVKATVTITFTSGNPYQAEVNGSTNIHGLLSIEFGDESLASRDWTNATIAVKVVNAATPSTVYVNDGARPVSAVPYALSVDGQSIQNYLTKHHYVDQTELDSRHYLTSDSAVIKTMQGNITTNANSIANLTLHTTQRAIRDSVAGQIHDSIVNIAAKSHIHGNKDLLDTYTQTEANLAEAVAKMHEHANAAVLAATEAPYTDADSAKLRGIQDSAEVNVQANWKQTDGSKDDYIKNKPSITDTVNNILTTDGYVTASALDNRHYLSSDSAVIITMQDDISKNANSIDNLILHTAKAAIRDSVAGQIHDSISNVAGKAHTHDNKALLDTYTQTEANLAEAVSKKHSHENMAVLNATMAPYTDADSTKLDGIESGAQKNVQSDWKQTDGSKDDYIKNKPSIKDTVNNILTTGKYVTETTLDGRHYLTSDSAVIKTMQGNITSLQSGLSAAIGKEKTDSTTLAGRIDALEGAAMDCNKVKECIKDTLSNYSTTAALNDLLQQLTARLDAQDTKIDAQNAKIDSLAHVVDSLAKLVHGGGQPCPDAPTVSDGTNIYNTVKIGNQCWMKENLRTTTNRNNVGNIYINTTEGYDAETYGYHYDWAAVMQDEFGDKVRGICPEGWHVPSDAEWTVLTDYVKGKSEYICGEGANNIANALADTTGWSSNTSSGCNAGNTGGKANLTGFSALPAGNYYDGWHNFGSYAYFWSATQTSDTNAWCWFLRSENSSLLRSNYVLKDYGYSVRCLRD